MADDQLPRLSDSGDPSSIQTRAIPVDRSRPELTPDWLPFEEPELIEIQGPGMVVIASRALMFIWSVSVVVAALVVRSNVGNGTADGFPRWLAWCGVVVTVAASVAGWRWTDSLTRNVHALEGRLPRRPRCVTAWLAPLLWSAVLAATVLQLRPGELLDVRPSIAVLIFTAAMWRPYALVRRILTSLIRVGSDTMIGSAFVLDIAAVGLLWWQLWTFPDKPTASASGAIDVVIGVSAAAAIALGANLVLWRFLVRAMASAQAHRLVAIGTRHVHRQLRLRGINPMDPEVRYALMKIRAAESHQRATLAAQRDDLEATEPVARRAGRPSAARTADTHIEEARSDSETVVPGPADVVPPAGNDAADGDRASLRTDQASGPPGLPPSDAEAEQDAAEEAVSDSGVTSPTGPLAAASSDSAADLVPSTVPLPSLLSRLEKFGIRATMEPGLASGQPSAAEPETETGRDWILPRLLGLEAARYLLIMAIVTSLSALTWLTYKSVSVGGGVVDGRIAVGDVRELNDARIAVMTMIGIAATVGTVWSLVLSRHARSVDVPDIGRWWSVVLFAAAMTATVMSFVFDPYARGSVSFICLVIALGATVASSTMTLRISRWFGLSNVMVSVWSVGLAWIVVTLWIGGLHRSTAPTDDLESLTFLVALQAIVAAVLAVVIGLHTGEAVDEIKLAAARRTSRGEVVDGSTA